MEFSKRFLVLLLILSVFGGVQLIEGSSNYRQQCSGVCSNCDNLNCSKNHGEATVNFLNFSAVSLDGKTVKMKDFKGKVILVVNTASKCGLTPQYKGLEEVYKKHKAEGLVILGFPCNQFGKQEPGTNEEIGKFCEVNYGVTFPVFSKIEVNGDGAHPIYKYLKSELKGEKGQDIRWNFTKFLIDREGNPYKRFSPRTEPEAIVEDIKKLLKES